MGYTVLATDDEKHQVRIKADNGRIGWFPAYCFDQSHWSVLTLACFHLEDPIRSDEDLPIEVMVELSNDERRWCIFATPSALANCGDWIEGTDVPFLFGNCHIIIAKKLSEDLIGRMLDYIDSQGELVACTPPPLETVDDKKEAS